MRLENSRNFLGCVVPFLLDGSAFVKICRRMVARLGASSHARSILERAHGTSKFGLARVTRELAALAGPEGPQPVLGHFQRAEPSFAFSTKSAPQI